MIRIIIADSREEHRKRLFATLSAFSDFKIAGEAEDSYETLKLVESLKPEAAIIALDMPGIDIIKFSKMIKKRSPETAILVHANPEDWRLLYRALSSLTTGFITRMTSPDMLFLSINVVIRGGAVLAPEITSRFQFYDDANSEEKPLSEYFPVLTIGDLQVLALIRDGYTHEEIACKLKLKPQSVRNRASRILKKTGLHDRTQLALYANRYGL
jgi:DNA-binding NarL/FixJ family response regulator